jgi:ABC-type transport system substrate-binding protein
MSSARLIVAAVAAVALVASGCGKSSKSTSTPASTATAAQTTVSTSTAPVGTQPGKPLTRAQLFAAAEPICSHLGSLLHATPGDFRSAAAITRVFTQAAAYERIEYNELRKLIPPKSMASDWKKFLEGTRQWSEDSATIAAYARANNVEGAKPVAKIIFTTHEKLTKLAKHDGFQECGVT